MRSLHSLQINGDRLLQRLEQLAQVGGLPNGGVSRLAYSEADQQARLLVQDWMQRADLTVRIDAAGNVIGRYAGNEDNLGAIATGSHLDTVPIGGHYDGTLGVISGLEVVCTLRDAGKRLRHPIEVIVFCDEEGSMIGSRAMTGPVPSELGLQPTASGPDLAHALSRIGGCWEEIRHAQRSPRDFHAFLELHVEQGPVLEHHNCTIGVVTGIVGQQRHTITITGQANHAGTTPMTMRQDALVAAAQIILTVQELALQNEGETVATVGQLNVTPNMPNVVPGQVQLTVDLRDICDRHLAKFQKQLTQQLQEIATQTQTAIAIEPTLNTQAALAHPQLQGLIEQTCRELNLSSTHLPSRAGHDAQAFAAVTPMGMIFVPSQHGVSHAETEYTTPEHCLAGTEVLLKSVCHCDRHEF